MTCTFEELEDGECFRLVGDRKTIYCKILTKTVNGSPTVYGKPNTAVVLKDDGFRGRGFIVGLGDATKVEKVEDVQITGVIRRYDEVV